MYSVTFFATTLVSAPEVRHWGQIIRPSISLSRDTDKKLHRTHNTDLQAQTCVSPYPLDHYRTSQPTSPSPNPSLSNIPTDSVLPPGSVRIQEHIRTLYPLRIQPVNAPPKVVKGWLLAITRCRRVPVGRAATFHEAQGSLWKTDLAECRP